SAFDCAPKDIRILLIQIPLMVREDFFKTKKLTSLCPPFSDLFAGFSPQRAGYLERCGTYKLAHYCGASFRSRYPSGIEPD
ncbi:hypothetical protein, partial [Thermofilum sp.]|uniref:hypothetical protein n=1 Tax=Thermofilum sp. TaxID=1961369 RepID=UPI00318181C9